MVAVPTSGSRFNRFHKAGSMLLLFVVIAAWFLTMASTSGPDADFHLASTWCAGGIRANQCEEGTSPRTRRVPEFILGNCSRNVQVGVCGQKMVETARLNTPGLHNQIFYKLNALLVGEDPRSSILLMRIFNAALFLGIVLAALFLSSPLLRRTFAIGLAISMPAILRSVTSVTNQAWEISGLVGCWVFILEAFRPANRSRIRRGISLTMAIFCAVLVGVTRWDGVILLILECTACLAILLSQRGVRLMIIVSWVIGLMLLLLLTLNLFAPQRLSVPYMGILHGESAVNARFDFSTWDLVFHNFHHSARFVLESLGGRFSTAGEDGALGPTIFILPFILGWLASLVIERLTSTYIVVTLIVAGGLVAFPVLASASNAETLPGLITPRYIAPFAVAAIGLLLFSASNSGALLKMRNTTRHMLVAVISISQASALHIALRERVSGTNVGISTVNLNNYVLWWPDIWISPLTVWFSASVAFTLFLNLELKQSDVDDFILG